MILVFGGTTEGRVAVRTLDESGQPYFYSTRGTQQQVECKHGTHIAGAMTAEAMTHFCREHGIRLIVDAAHPFASQLHETIGAVASDLNLPVVRLERRYHTGPDSGIVWCDTYADAVARMLADGITRLLALTGVQTIGKLRGFWQERDCWFRILDREESFAKARESGFPADRLCLYSPDEDIAVLIRTTGADAVITKESGDSGGFEEKLEGACEAGVPLYVVRRPKLPPEFITVTGEHGLRREVQRLVPDYFPLRTGFTTGACATAAATAAALALFRGEIAEDVKFEIPSGEIMTMPIHSVTVTDRAATASVIKDAGDDPDVTDGYRIVVTLAKADHAGIRFIGGEGVGTVTLPGVGLDIGEPAINPVPRRMIAQALQAFGAEGLDVTVSVPGGAELAAKTFNPRIGIVGGISIIGTSGIVRPFSHEAFVESMRREMEVALALGCERIVVNSGAKSERFVKALYPALPPQAFIHYGNAVGDIMKLAAQLNVKQLTIGLMIGKAVKLAEGNTDTHSHKVTVNREFLASIALECDCPDTTVEAINQINMARELWTLPRTEATDRFFGEILRRCRQVCAAIYPGNLEALLITDEGKILYRLQ